MHKDSGLTTAGRSGAAGDRRSTLSAGDASDPNKPRGDSSGDSGAEDLQEGCSDDKLRAETHNTANNAPAPDALQSTSDAAGPPSESRPNIIRPKIIETFASPDRGDIQSSTLPRQSRQPLPSQSTRDENAVGGDELDEWLLRKFQTEMVVKNRTRSASAQRPPTVTSIHPTLSDSASDRRQQYAQTLGVRKAVRFCE